MQVHSTAVIDPGAALADDVEVGPYAIIESGAVIADGCRIGSHAIIGANTSLGRDNVIHSHAAIGTASQDLKYKGEISFAQIGSGNIFREFVTVNRATGEGKATKIGNRCLLMAYSHVAHNCVLEDGVELANCAQLGGDVHVEQRAKIGGLVGIHQFCRIGAFAMIGACSKVAQDILPYVRADGHPARPRGLNVIGLERNGFSPEEILRLKQVYRRLFLHGLLWDDAVGSLQQEFPDDSKTQRLLDFIQQSSRNIARPATRSDRSPRQED